MADKTVDSCEQPKFEWSHYSDSELRRYIFRNMHKMDCSFVIKDPKSRKSDKVVGSFKWILCKISPVLKEILNDETNQAKNCKSIPVFDQNFKEVITFAHTKHIDDGLFDNMLDLFESAAKYKIEALRDAIYNALREKESFASLNWINFFRLKNMDFSNNVHKMNYYSLNLLFYNTILPKMTAHDMERELGLESNIEMISDFDIETFDELFCIITQHSLNAHLCLRVVEAYLIKNILKGKKPSSPEELDNVVEDCVKSYLKRIKFEEMSLKEFHNGPAKSNLLDEAFKKHILAKINK